MDRAYYTILMVFHMKVNLNQDFGMGLAYLDLIKSKSIEGNGQLTNSADRESLKIVQLSTKERIKLDRLFSNG
jgi:hypothetical protein